ncbi:MAG: tRNA (adenosine(37)-N6)-threonylcarbamoyltransferase complex dimerization subunit type 1 TsaB, partial [Candidatus Cloacimonadaceae bacterium]|nr:tRNA (adenosine(37)-N6)-threonylcarbamoyltransferase complex dimerization subunit type 1 TsaB [Candidatus Cloacimonadaceae bacterium]
MILALDTSQSAGSIALQREGRLIYSVYFDLSITHSETLMPQIDAALKFCGFLPKDISAILLCNGPGSFTGLRIGLATAKGIAFGLNVPLYCHDALKLCALQRFQCGRNILTVIDAKMRDIYAALYDENLNVLEAPRVCKPEEINTWNADGAYILGSASSIVSNAIGESGMEFVLAAGGDEITGAAALFSLQELMPAEEIGD